MYVKSTRPSAKRDDQIVRPRRAQTCERSELRAKRALRMCPRSGQIFFKCIQVRFAESFISFIESFTNLSVGIIRGFKEGQSRSSESKMSIWRVTQH